ncbi:MAG: PASTA domain-containing protein [Acidobacteria bacterium]|nr:PASTA domain-containing protein [Acidobacteriota bacterium]
MPAARNVMMAAMAVKENTAFVGAFNPTKFEEIEREVAKAVVISQEPAAGEMAWPGTKINLRMILRSSIPVGTITGIDATVSQKYEKANLGVVEAEIGKSEAKTIIDAKEKYQQLTPVEKEKVDQYIATQYGAAANKETVYNSLSLLMRI